MSRLYFLALLLFSPQWALADHSSAPSPWRHTGDAVPPLHHPLYPSSSAQDRYLAHETRLRRMPPTFATTAEDLLLEAARIEKSLTNIPGMEEVLIFDGYSEYDYQDQEAVEKKFTSMVMEVSRRSSRVLLITRGTTRGVGRFLEIIERMRVNKQIPETFVTAGIISEEDVKKHTAAILPTSERTVSGATSILWIEPKNVDIPATVRVLTTALNAGMPKVSMTVFEGPQSTYRDLLRLWFFAPSLLNENAAPITMNLMFNHPPANDAEGWRAASDFQLRALQLFDPAENGDASRIRFTQNARSLDSPTLSISDLVQTTWKIDLSKDLEGVSLDAEHIDATAYGELARIYRDHIQLSPQDFSRLKALAEQGVITKLVARNVAFASTLNPTVLSVNELGDAGIRAKEAMFRIERVLGSRISDYARWRQGIMWDWREGSPDIIR